MALKTPRAFHPNLDAERPHTRKWRLLKMLAVLTAFITALCLFVCFTAECERQDSDQLPLLKLDYGTYRAILYDNAQDMYTFKNIRYAAPPLGELRWRKPAPPPHMSEIQDGSEGFDCYQDPQNPIVKFPISEDCLFLDVYVPGAALRNPSKSALPTVVWIHGGSNRSGSKDTIPNMLYNGTGLLDTAENSMILVTANYRLGAFGWLSGDTSEKSGLPNAGLHDQRAALEWVKKYIPLLGGDPSQISAWGESAGASNIFHHLVAQGGTLDPIFSKALLQSPSTLSNVDRLGDSEDCFRLFARLAGCVNAEYECLRNTESQVLAVANLEWSKQRVNCGNLASDGTFIRQAATLEFATGNYWKNLDSLIVTHVANEPDLFLPEKPLTSDSDFEKLIARYFPVYAKPSGILDAILEFFPSPSVAGSPFANQTERLTAWILDLFTGTRVYSLVQSYPKNIYSARYSVPSELNGLTFHAADLIPLFWNQYLIDQRIVIVPPFDFLVPPNIKSLRTAFQSLMVSHVKTGDPNKLAIVDDPVYPLVYWPHAGPFTKDGLINNVLDFAPNGSTVITDPDILQRSGEFVMHIAIALTNVGGYAVPGSAMISPIASCESSTAEFASRAPHYICASRNYVDQCKECRVT